MHRAVRRLAAIAPLCLNRGSLPEALEALDTGNVKAWFAGAHALLCPRDAAGYWDQRLSWRGAPREESCALIGADRRAAIISNILLPFLAARGKDIRPLLAALPYEGGNTLVRQTASHLFGPDSNPALYRNGLRQQGLLPKRW